MDTMARRMIIVDPGFGATLKELREQRRLSLRRLGERAYCSHGYLWDLESGAKRPSASVAKRLDAVLEAGGRLSAMVREMSADSGLHSAVGQPTPEMVPAGLEFAPDWRLGFEVAAALWQGDMQRRDLLRTASFNASAYLAPAMGWLTATLDERPVGDGDRLVGAPDVEVVRRITAAYRELDNQFGGGHIRDSVVRFLDGEVSALLRGRYDRQTGVALLSAAAEMTQLAGWASYDMNMHGLAQRYLVQALRLAAAAGDRGIGAEILAAMSHQAAYLRSSAEAVALARAADRTAGDAGIAAIQSEAAVLEAQGHAVGGDEAACAGALDRAERTLDRADRTADPHWIGYFDEAYLSAKFGHCFAALGRGDLALRFAQRSLDMDRRYARGRQFNLALVAVSHAQSGNPERAAAVGMEAADAAEGLNSARARDYLADIARRLAPHAGLPAVRSFAERVRQAVG